MAIRLSTEEAFGRAVLAARTLLRMEQKELGNEVGVSAGTISNIEYGKHNLNEETMLAILAALRESGVVVHFDDDNKTILLALPYRRRLS